MAGGRELWGLAMLLAGLTAASAGGQHQGEPEGPLGERMELLRMWRLVEELELDEEQAARIFPVLRRQRLQQRELEAERREVLDQLEARLDSAAGDSELLQTMAAARSVQSRQQAQEKAFDEELASLLTARQQARLLLFDQRFRRDLRDLARRLRSEDGSGRGPGPEGGAGREESRRRWSE